MRTSRLCSSLASILGLTAAYKNQFIVPPPSDGLGGWDSDKVYALGSTVQFSWRTEWPNVSLGVWHIPPGEVNGILYNLVKQGITGFDRNSVWKVDVELSAWFNPALGPVCYLSVFDVDDISMSSYFNSDYFNVTNKGKAAPAASSSLDSPSSSSGLATVTAIGFSSEVSQSTQPSRTHKALTTKASTATPSTASPAESTHALTPAAANPTSTSTATSHSLNTNTLDRSHIAGIAVGTFLGVCVVVVVAVVGWRYFRYRSRPQVSDNEQVVGDQATNSPNGKGEPGAVQIDDAQNSKKKTESVGLDNPISPISHQELLGTEAAKEMDGATGIHELSTHLY